MAMFHFLLLGICIISATNVFSNQDITVIESPAPVSLNDGSNTTTTNTNVDTTIQNRRTRTNGPVNQRDGSNTTTTNTNLDTTIENRQTRTNGPVNLRDGSNTTTTNTNVDTTIENRQTPTNGPVNLRDGSNTTTTNTNVDTTIENRQTRTNGPVKLRDGSNTTTTNAETTLGNRQTPTNGPVNQRDGSNTSTTKTNVDTTIENRQTRTSGPIHLRDGSNTATTNTDIDTTIENRQTPIKEKVINRKPTLKNHSCSVMEILSCECSPAPMVLSDLVVNCSSRNLSRVPLNIPTNTVELILSGNKIENISIGVFENLTRLKQLDLSGNLIETFEDDIFTGLGGLESLYLHDNPFNLISSEFGDNVFTPLTSLKNLNLKSRNSDSEKTFTYPDIALGKLTSLQTLSIDGLNNRTFGEGFQNMTSLRTLDLSLSPHFNLISNDTFLSFQNIPVKTLLLNNSSLRWIHREALKYFPNIDTIDYSQNIKLEIAGVGKSFYGLQNTTIRKIIMQYVHSPTWFTSIDKQDVIYLTNTNLQELYVDYNSIVSFTNDALQYLPRFIKIISVSWNMIQTTLPQIWSLFKYRNLTEVNASYQMTYNGNFINNNVAHTRTTDFTDTNQPSSNTPDIHEFLDNTAELNMFTFDLSKDYAISFPPKLWNIKCSNTYKLKFKIPKFTLLNASVTHADFSHNLLTRWNGPVFGLEKLLHIDLSGNDCDYVSPQFFGFVPNLQTLRIALNRFGPELKENIFYNLTSLKTLDLHRNLLENTSPALFSRVMNLQELDISSNYLTSWEADISNLVNLSRLNLTDNKLSTLPQNLRDNLDKLSRLKSIVVDISGNPLNCICDTEDFVLWFTQSKLRFVNLTSTVCKLENGTKLSLLRSKDILKHLKSHCRSYTILIAVSSVCVGLSLVSMVTFIIHRNRWKIRYLLYVTLNRKERTGYQRLESDREGSQYFFDAFFSYEDSSRHFIIDEVIPRLETGIGLKLCIDKRDFVPGLFVTDNIMHAIGNSSKTVVILTKEFLKSKWCMYELNMARMEAIYNGRQSFIMVLLEDIPTESLPREILDLFRQQTYIEMVDNEYGAELFWNRLTAALKMDN